MTDSVRNLDVASLNDYLIRHMPGYSGPLSAEKFADGQSNPTFLLESGSGRYVLRRKPPGELLKSAHAVDREYRVLSALAASEVPVANMHLLCEDESIIGSMFYVMEYLDGRVLWDSELPELDNLQRSEIYADMVRVMSLIHRVDVDTADLSDFGRPGNYYSRQISRWGGQYKASETETITSMEELSTLGHPFADLAYQCMQLRLPAALGGLGDVDRAALGIPSEEEYVASYCSHMEIPAIKNWNFYIVFCVFRLAAILQGVRKRALDGNASSEAALERSEAVAPLADYAVSLI
jgi:aminoglycoside phosphotransferase (APT) family kinase protein